MCTKELLLRYKTAMDLGILDLHCNQVSDAVLVYEQLSHQHRYPASDAWLQPHWHSDKSVPLVAQQAQQGIVAQLEQQGIIER